MTPAFIQPVLYVHLVSINYDCNKSSYLFVLSMVRNMWIFNFNILLNLSTIDVSILLLSLLKCLIYFSKFQPPENCETLCYIVSVQTLEWLISQHGFQNVTRTDQPLWEKTSTAVSGYPMPPMRMAWDLTTIRSTSNSFLIPAMIVSLH